jgi:DNA-binding IclR family transcriptional regulator
VVRESDENLKSLSKIARILECFSVTQRALSLGEICRHTGLPKSTAHRLLASMREVGLLDQDRDRERYRLGLWLFELGNLVLSNMELHREARPIVEQLGRIGGQMVHLAVFDGVQAVVINRSDPHTDGKALPTLLENAPAHSTSVGKAILAFQPASVVERIVGLGLQRFTDTTITTAEALQAELAAIRERGYAVDDGEHEPGLRCIGAPIRDQSGRVFASISLSGPAWRMPLAEVEGLAKIVIHHAGSISARLGYAP